ncbi:MAG: RDD family protein [bacterium]|nr:RDD family protein [bacterium]
MVDVAPAGWYHAETDPLGVERYWDGVEWSADTRTAPPSTAAPSMAAPSMTAPVASGQRGGFPPQTSLASPWMRLGSWLLELVLMTFTLMIGWLIWATFTAGTGQTPAKKLLDLRVIRGDTMRPSTLGHMFWLRGILAGLVTGIALPVTLYILALMPFWDRNNQNLWDKVSNSYVVNDPTDAWHTAAPHAG